MKFMNWTYDFRLKCNTDFKYDLTCSEYGRGSIYSPMESIGQEKTRAFVLHPLDLCQLDLSAAWFAQRHS